MSEKLLGDISKKLNISKSTISRAARHCHGVDTDTRNVILEEYLRMGGGESAECDVYCIFPDLPKYFWSELYRGICAASESGIVIKYNVITKIEDCSTVLHYIDEAEKLNSRVLIIASIIDDYVREKIEALSSHMLVIILSEYANVKNCFYVGSDPYADGCAAGRYFLQHFSTRKLIMIDFHDSENTRAHISGFRDTIGSCVFDGDRYTSIKIGHDEPISYKLMPSRFARLLSEVSQDGEEYCIYFPSGVVGFDKALRKSNMRGMVNYLCHDTLLESDEFEAVSCNQDIFMQGCCAMTHAIRYIKDNVCPPQKFNFVPSAFSRVGK